MVSKTISDAGAVPATSTTALPCGGDLASTVLIEGIGDIWKATPITAQTINAKKSNLSVMRGRPAINTGEMAYAA